MAAELLPLSIPKKKVSAWVAETKPKDARHWVSHLPMADAGEAARELYQSLYTLNRLELPVQERQELMEIYEQPVQTVIDGLAHHFYPPILPLNEKKRQLAKFIRQLRQEMANGFKLVIRDVSESRRLWGKKKLKITAVESAVRYLGEILHSCYQVYVPTPPTVWRELNVLYRFSEDNEWFGDQVLGPGLQSSSPVYQRFLQVVLLGLCNPYQLPEREWIYVAQFLNKWSYLAGISDELYIQDKNSQFLIDLNADSPPLPYPKTNDLLDGRRYRRLDTSELARKVEELLSRLEDGVAARDLDIGIDCLDSACKEVLKRMRRFWGAAARRQHSRKKKKGRCFVVAGINALHFFASGQKPFVAPVSENMQRGSSVVRGGKSTFAVSVAPEDKPMDTDAVFIDLDRSELEPAPVSSTEQLADSMLPADEIYRVESWQLGDESAGGMSLSTGQSVSQHLRVGEILGVRDPAEDAPWQVVVVRWVKSQASGNVETGVEFIAPSVRPVATRSLRNPDSVYQQSLLVPAIKSLKQPASLLMPAGTYEANQTFMLADEEGERKVVALSLINESQTFNHVVFANARKEA